MLNNLTPYLYSYNWLFVIAFDIRARIIRHSVFTFIRGKNVKSLAGFASTDGESINSEEEDRVSRVPNWKLNLGHFLAVDGDEIDFEPSSIFFFSVNVSAKCRNSLGTILLHLLTYLAYSIK